MIEGRVNANGEATIYLLLQGNAGEEQGTVFVRDIAKPNRLWTESVLVDMLGKSGSMSMLDKFSIGKYT